MARNKSSKDLYEQTDRLIDTTAQRGWTGKEYSKASLSRIDRIAAINKRYQSNIARHFGSDDHLTNSQYATRVSRSVYMGLNVK